MSIEEYNTLSSASTAFIVLALLCAIIALLPSKYDPAIRLKEWLQSLMTKK
jgi:hypothetical protein